MSRLVLALLLSLLAGAIVAPYRARAEPRGEWQTVVVTMNGRQDIEEIETGRVYRASIWEGIYSKQRYAQFGDCLDEICSWVGGNRLAEDGRIYIAGDELEGVRFYLTYDDHGVLMGGTLSYDSDRFRLR